MYSLKKKLTQRFCDKIFLTKFKFSIKFFQKFLKRKLKFAHPGVDLRSSRGGHIEFDHVHEAAHLTAPD
jgi:hypothetical protein